MRSLIIALFVVVFVSAPAQADVWRVEKADRQGSATKIRYVEEYQTRQGWHRLAVDYADGSGYVFTPCRFEDSRNCYWNARRSGNKRGKSFVNKAGRVTFVRIVR